MNYVSTKAALTLAVCASLVTGCQTTDAPTNRVIEKTVRAELVESASSTKQYKTQQVAEIKNADGETLKCKTERLSGSRLGGQEVCMTQKEWDEVRAENAKQLKDFTLHGAKNYK